MDATACSVITSKCSALWGRCSHDVTVGLCMDIVEIGLATHLRYIRHAPVRTDRIATKGGLRPNYVSSTTSEIQNALLVY